ncbi:zinc ribbon domain-containing protein [Pseudomonas taetrolens]|uniref:zinc ribbon domain-containing protein n=1 Tax=Pseudomonas taetrolens TaxID=47884 RepID=UPI003F9D6DF7
MQLAILLVLIVIAVILAPWLLGLIAVGIAAYGLWLIISLAVAAVFSILVVSAILMSGSKRTISSKTEQIISEVNEQYREKEAAERAAAHEASEIGQAKIERVKKVRVVECPNCSATIAKHSLYCPQCGKSTKPRSASND